jgi:[CysO sulfur-carrier protein]-S-L-cysteine hydrolase|tara:strand:+ start:287 stop:721 length:435 start_codon:yes stop_codon:yes gene_type:complete
MILKIPIEYKKFIVNHAKADAPNEACGIIHCFDSKPSSIYKVTNVANSPYRYEMDGIEQLELEKKRDITGEQLFGIYHSHVATEAKPSPTDIRMAFFPPGNFDSEPMFDNIFYILVSLENEIPDVRFFSINQGPEVVEIDVNFE